MNPNPMLVFKTRNGYAAVPFTGEFTAGVSQDMLIATTIDAAYYSSRGPSLAEVLKDHFEPEEAPEITSIKAVA